MKTKLKAIVFMIFMLAIICIGTKVQAASASISATKTTATVGDSVTISVSINAAAWNLKVTGTGVSGGNIVGYDPDGANASTSKTYSLSTSTAGTYTIYLTGDVTDGSTDVNSPINKSVTVTVNPKPAPPTNTGGSTTGGNSNSGSTNNKPSTGGTSNSGSGNSNSKPSTGSTTTTTKPEEKKSNDSTLKGLVIEGYELYPEFETNTREYNLRVTNDITKVTVVPTVNNEKASYKIEGATEELVVGKNVITVVVTAEDGSSSNYVINVTRNREGLNVENIKLFYTDETGNKQEIVLNPVFSSEIFEYTLDNLSHLINKLDVEVLTNFEEAKIEIEGNENLFEGENTITITVTMPSENEEEADEVLTYTIKVQKEAEPVITLMGRIKNWFNGITGTVSTWFKENVNEILLGSLILCSFALGGLSVYLVSAYKKYKLMLQKIAELTKINNAEIIETTENTVEEQNLEIEPEIKPRGRHF